MSAYEDFVKGLVDKDAIFLIGAKPVKGKITKITEDLVQIKLEKPLEGAKTLVLQLNNLILVDS